MLCPRRQTVSPSGWPQLRWGFPARGFPSPAEVTCSGSAERRRRALLRVERELSKADYKSALSIVKQLPGKARWPWRIRRCQTGPISLSSSASMLLELLNFNRTVADQVPKRLLKLDELKIEDRELSYLKPIVDSVVDSIQRCIQFASTEDEASADPIEKIELEEGDENLSREDYAMFAQHEAGHFLAGYLLGILPKEYKLLKKGTSSRDQITGGKVSFVGFDFLREVPTARVLKNAYRDKGCISSKMFNYFSCVILGGLVAEHLVFGYSEGLHSDVDKLDRVMKWLGLTEEEAEFHIRWAATNTTFILHQHLEAGSRLAEAMASGKSIGRCIEIIEHAISGDKP